MTDRPSAPRSREAPPVEIDSNVASVARTYDYLLGGTNNFAVDREAAIRAGEAVGGIDNARSDVRANRAFMGRAVRHLAGDVGIRQFLDIGTGIPNDDHVHGVAQQTAPDARIVYVDNDPVVLAHAHSLLRSTPEGTAAFIHGDLHDPESILQQAAETLNFSKPVALMLVAVMHVIPEDDDPYGIVSRLVAALPSGSYLVLSHLTNDIRTEEMARLAGSVGPQAAYTFSMRSRADVGRFFEGLEILDPGIVSVDDWRRDEAAPTPPPGRVTPIYGAVGRKP